MRTEITSEFGTKVIIGDLDKGSEVIGEASRENRRSRNTTTLSRNKMGTETELKMEGNAGSRCRLFFSRWEIIVADANGTFGGNIDTR